MSKVFYFTDIHGNEKLFHAVYHYCMSNSPDCTIIYGGDANDRGPNGYNIMKQLLAANNIIYLKGNHEDMFVKAAQEFKQHFPNPQFDEVRLEAIFKSIRIFDYKYENLQLLLANGGKQTIIDWFLDGLNTNLIDQLDSLPLTYSYKNLDFCHAGATYEMFLSPQNYKLYLLWDRDLIHYGWTKDRICIHGHSPVQLLFHSDSPIIYRGTFKDDLTGEKINMDVGTFYSQKIYVLDCDSMSLTEFIENVDGQITIQENLPLKKYNNEEGII